jgi:hypothetical protein
VLNLFLKSLFSTVVFAKQQFDYSLSKKNGR